MKKYCLVSLLIIPAIALIFSLIAYARLVRGLPGISSEDLYGDRRVNTHSHLWIFLRSGALGQRYIMRYSKKTRLPGVAFAAIPAALAGPNQASGNHRKATQDDVTSAAGRSNIARNEVEPDFTQVGPVVNWTFVILREEVENSLQTDFQRFQLKADNSRSYISRSFFKRRHQWGQE